MLCPVSHESAGSPGVEEVELEAQPTRVTSLIRHDLIEALIAEPIHTQEYVADARSELVSYYTRRRPAKDNVASKLDTEPVHLTQKSADRIARQLRSAAWAAMFRVAAGSVVGDICTLLEREQSWPKTGPLGFSLDDYVTPLPNLPWFPDIESAKLSRHVRTAGGLVLECMNRGLFDPPRKYEPLAKATEVLYAEHSEAVRRAGKKITGAGRTDLDGVILSASEDNGQGLVSTVLGAATHAAFMSRNDITPAQQARFAYKYWRQLTGRATVNRDVGRVINHVVYTGEDRLMAHSISRVYDDALLMGGPIDIHAGYFGDDPTRMQPAHPSLAANGVWREPEMCSGFPRVSDGCGDKLGPRLLRQVTRMILPETTAGKVFPGQLRTDRRVSGIDLTLHLLVLDAIDNVYPNFPEVIDPSQGRIEREV